MSTLLWVLVLTSVATFIYQWLLAWSAAPLNRQAIRHQFLLRLQAAVPGLETKDWGDDGLSLRCDGRNCQVHLDQLYRRCAENPSNTSLFVRQAVGSLAQSLSETDTLPADWEQRAVPLLVRTDAPTPPDLIVRPFMEESCWDMP